MDLQIPKPAVDLKAIRLRYHSAKAEQEKNAKRGRPRGERKASAKK
jgi:hypothetical protein